MLVGVEMPFDGLPVAQVHHHDVGQFVGHALG